MVLEDLLQLWMLLDGGSVQLGNLGEARAKRSQDQHHPLQISLLARRMHLDVVATPDGTAK